MEEVEEIDEKEWAMLCEDAKNMDKNKSEKGFGFVQLIRIIAIVTSLGEIIAGFAVENFWWMFLISAFLSAILWWALSIIVEACQHYLNTK